MATAALALIAFGIMQTQLNRERDNSVQVLNERAANDQHYMKRSPVWEPKFTVIYEGGWIKKLAAASVVRAPKLIGLYSGAWSKKLKVASKLTKNPIKKFYFGFSSVFDKGIAKFFLKVPIPPSIGR